jgi:hypothetical protein
MLGTSVPCVRPLSVLRASHPLEQWCSTATITGPRPRSLPSTRVTALSPWSDFRARHKKVVCFGKAPPRRPVAGITRSRLKVRRVLQNSSASRLTPSKHTLRGGRPFVRGRVRSGQRDGPLSPLPLQSVFLRASPPFSKSQRFVGHPWSDALD